MRLRTTLDVMVLAFGIPVLVGFRSGRVIAFAAGTLALRVSFLVAWRRYRWKVAMDPGRRRFLRVMGLVGLGLVAGGAEAGRAVRRLARPDPMPVLDEMARTLGAEALEFVRRSYHPDRSGDLQLVLTPGCTAKYAQESQALLPRDPRSTTRSCGTTCSAWRSSSTSRASWSGGTTPIA